MSMAINFRGGGETTGGVSDRKIETAKQETAGGVGARQKQDSIFLTEEPKCDTVCFRGSDNIVSEQKKPSAGLIFASLVADAAILVGLLGLAYKNKWVDKMSDGTVKNFFKHSDKVTEPCYKACKWIKNNAYDKIANLLKK